MWSRVPEPVRACCQTLWAAGHAAHPVGGCLRDLLLGRPPGDWDLAVSARPEQVMALFARTVPTGLRHGTVTVLLGGMALEVTTFRREGAYTDGRRPDQVSFGGTLAEDLARRDFTINAMALNRDGAVTDPHGGRGDLEHRVIRCVGDPVRRFSEDALRMFRAVRFAAQLDFQIQEHTRKAMEICAPRADLLSGERVKAEVEKLLLSPNPELAGLLVALGLLSRFGAAPANLSHLRQLPPTPLDRWPPFCAATGLDPGRLPMERALRRAIRHPEQRALAALALTGRDLYDLGYRGGDISRLRRDLLAHVQAHPRDNRAEVLKARLKDLPHA